MPLLTNTNYSSTFLTIDYNILAVNTKYEIKMGKKALTDVKFCLMFHYFVKETIGATRECAYYNSELLSLTSNFSLSGSY